MQQFGHILMPWYFTIPMAILYMMPIIYMSNVFIYNWKRRHIEYKQLEFNDFNRILRSNITDVYAMATLGVRDSIFVFNRLGMDFFYAIEKLYHKNQEYIVEADNYDQDSREYHDMEYKEIHWISLLNKVAVTIGNQCTDRITYYGNDETKYPIDYATLSQFIYNVSALKMQYQKAKTENFIPGDMQKKIDTTYRIFFDYFELVIKKIDVAIIGGSKRYVK